MKPRYTAVDMSRILEQQRDRIVKALRDPDNWEGFTFREQHWTAAADMIEREFGAELISVEPCTQCGGKGRVYYDTMGGGSVAADCPDCDGTRKLPRSGEENYE